MANTDKPPTPHQSEVLLELQRLDVGSAVALVGHPIHVMMVHFPVAFVVATLGVDVFYWWSGDPFWLRVGVWAAGAAFWTGVGASIVGTGELLLVRGIRLHEASWSHAIAAMTLVAIAGASWGLRMTDPAIGPAAWPGAVGARLGHGRLRRLARGQAGVRSWRSESWCRRRTDGTVARARRARTDEWQTGSKSIWGLASTTQRMATINTG